MTSSQTPRFDRLLQSAGLTHADLPAAQEVARSVPITIHHASIVAARISVNGRPVGNDRITVRRPERRFLAYWLGVTPPKDREFWSWFCPHDGCGWGGLFTSPLHPDIARIKAHTDATLHATTHHKETR